MSKSPNHSNIILVTGPSGAGRSTSINVFEDMGYETIDSMPLSLVPNLLSGPPVARKIALGVDIRTRDFDVGSVIDLHESINRTDGFDSTLLYLDCDTSALMRRYNETRRRHPLTPDQTPQLGIEQEKQILDRLKSLADTLVDTTALTPHDLKAELFRLFDDSQGKKLSVTLHSFSYKRGVPRGVDMTFDCRFLNNPHWDEKLRNLNGKDADVAQFVMNDARYDEFLDRLNGFCSFLLPAYIDEGKAHFSIGLGCTGGQHRSVCVTEDLAKSLADSGWQVSIRHRELERQ